MVAFAFQAISSLTNDIWVAIQGTLFLIGTISVSMIIAIHIIEKEIGYNEKEET